jgi:ubiquinone/menaquinone biosynthesis C-methylase UbiE
MESTDPVQEFYNQLAQREWDRLERPPDNLEFATASHLIAKYFNKPGRACDIGAGPGRYSQLLASRGHHVTVVDLSPELLKIAQGKLAHCADQIVDFICASATDLHALPDKQFNYALMMGPMYHLTHPHERQRALAEFRRILADDGLGLVTFFGSYGMLRLGIADFHQRFKDRSQVERFLAPTTFTDTDLSSFTACHFTTPDAIAAELSAAGLHTVSYASAQGFAGGIRSDLEQLFQQSPEAFQNVLTVAVETCEDPRFRDCGQHLHYIVKKR